MLQYKWLIFTPTQEENLHFPVYYQLLKLNSILKNRHFFLLHDDQSCEKKTRESVSLKSHIKFKVYCPLI